MVRYNAGGPWEILLVDDNGAVFNDRPSLELNAIGQFGIVPEPSIYVLRSAGLSGLLFTTFLRRLALRPSTGGTV